MARGFDLELKGFKEFADTMDPDKFRRRLKHNVGKATKLNALVAEGEIKRQINSGGNYDPNSQITILLKGSSRPLVDTGSLVASINSKTRWDVAFIGVLKSRQETKDDGTAYDLLNVAFILHEGASIKVTQKMRNFFALMSRENPGKWFPLNPGTKVISIPRRPFLEAALSKKLEKIYLRNWGRAMVKTMNPKRRRGI